MLLKFQKEDRGAVEELFRMYWNDPEFLEKLYLKLQWAIDESQEYFDRKYRFFVAEESGEVVGIIGSRVAPEHMKIFSKTENPAELYIVASKYMRRGIARELVNKMLDTTKDQNFTEVVLYSPNSHKDSWGFYDKMNFESVGPAVAPDGEPGNIFRKII